MKTRRVKLMELMGGGWGGRLAAKTITALVKLKHILENAPSMEVKVLTSF